MTTATKTKDPKTEIVPIATTSVPAFLAAKAHEDAGKGVSNDASDNIVPLIYLLQSNSPQCNPRGPDHVENGVSGNIWLRGTGRPAIDGEQGILVQPCFFNKVWTEWRLPRGNGLAGVHADKPADAKEAPSPENPEKTIWLLDNGNQVVETRNHVVRVFLEDKDGNPTGEVMPFVIAMAGTQHTVSRMWMALMGAKQIGKDQAPSWASRYRVTTKSKTKGANTWNVFDVDDAGWIETQEDYEAGLALHEAFAKGEKIAEAAEDAAEPQGDNAAM